jgi:hypothetical protein
MAYDYYEEEAQEGYDSDSFIGKVTSIDKKKLAIILVILLLLTIGILIGTGVISPDGLIPIGPGNNGEVTFTTEAGVKLKVRGSTTKAGDTDTFNTDGDILNVIASPTDQMRISINTTGLPRGLGVGTVTILGPNGEILSTSTGNTTYDENGQIVIILDPELDLGLDGNLLDYDGTSDDYTFQVTLNDNNTGDEVIFEIPMTIGFSEFIGTGCIALSRSSVSETTHYGALELEAKIRILCETNDDLFASVNWGSKNMGPVEVLFDKKYSNGTSLVSDYQVIEESPFPGEYIIRIYFVPSTKYVGKNAKFDVDFKLGNAEQTIKFDIAVENLEQCIAVSSSDPIISNENDEAIIFIDAKNCASRKINIYLCDGDYGCSGGTSEGEINLDNGYFNLSGGKSKTIKVQRGEIPGVYGITVHASIPGKEKTFIDEKEITVLPTTEYVYPEEFVVSLLESGTRDSVVVRNNLLAEDVAVDASICDVYSSSIGESDNESWLFKMYNSIEYYSGEGLYIAGLTDAIAEMDQAMFSAKNLSYAENTLIKDAYISTEDVEDASNDLLDDASLSLSAASDLADELDSITQNENVNLASSIISLVTSISSSITTMSTITTEISAAQSLLSTTSAKFGSVCNTTASYTTITEALTEANSSSSLAYVEAIEILNLLNNLYTIWQQIESLTEDDQTIDATTAVDNAEEAYAQIVSWEEEANDALDYMELALEAAAIDALSSAASDDLDAKQYLELAKSNLGTIKDKADDAYIYQLAAYDAITTALADEPETIDLVSQGLGLLYQLVSYLPVTITRSELVSTRLETVQTQINTVKTANQTYGSTCNEPWVTAPCPCDKLLSTNESDHQAINAKITAALSSNTSEIARWVGYLGTLNSLYSAFQLYESLQGDFAETLTAANTQFNDLTQGIITAQTNAYLAYTDADNAITAAQKLYLYEIESSDASTYEYDNYVTADFVEKQRMQGLIGSIISTGFVNGAKEGGVYSTNDTLGAADCENRVTMTLPDYKINLPRDVQNPIVHNNDIIAQWDFSEVQVYDFFKEQQAAINFSDNGLTKNSYAIIELPIKKHDHAPTTLVNGDFGPFNIPDSSVEDLTYKYHFKFNMEERKSANPTKSAVCEKGILFGETGTDAGAHTILSWDWNAISTNSIQGKYIDATQLSILIAKKLTRLDDFFKRVSVSCPKNYAFDVARGVTPTDIELTKTGSCYLPLSTKYYEGKPSIYHQLDYVVDPGNYPAGYDPFFDEPIISDAQQFLDVVDFNVNLMLDGYGTNFQDDFSDDYTKALFKSNPSFTDPNIGTYKYFDNDNIFFYSSKPKGYQKDNDFILPDAGKYRVRILIEFDGTNPQLFSVGSTKAKVIVDLELIEPINKDFSPLYYTPYDGTVGLKLKNNRKDYGSALTTGSNFDIIKNDGIFLTTDQKDALAKLTHTKLIGFTWLNTLASKRAKILDYSYTVEDGAQVIFSPTTATPILMKINGEQGKIPYLTYQVSQGKDVIAANSNSLFLWTGIDGCNDFYGGPLNELINNTPDFRADQAYGMFFAHANTPGEIYLKTVAYTPVDEAYGLSAMGEGTIITTNNLIPVDGLIQLDGISEMSFNDLPNNSKIDSLADIFTSVDNGSVCVSQLGNREVYWWPEEYLYEKENASEESLRDQELSAKSQCIRN